MLLLRTTFILILDCSRLFLLVSGRVHLAADYNFFYLSFAIALIFMVIVMIHSSISSSSVSATPSERPNGIALISLIVLAKSNKLLCLYTSLLVLHTNIKSKKGRD